jgi:RNA polymerase sigma factor (sigma-70 family)
MAHGQLTIVLHHIHELLDRSISEEASDAELVERFLAQRDEAAFGTLVRRHGSLVLRVCQRVLHDSHAAEDAFQATFFILARKAATIRRQESMAGWLYAVAFRVAQRARSQGLKRQRQERVLTDQAACPPVDDDPWMREVLQEELARLADKFRAPLVLCYLQGKTYGEAARELGWSEGSMSRLLAQAREQLRLRLVRRGVALAGTAIAAALEADTAVAIPAPLVEATVRGAGAPTAAIAGLATPAMTLVQGVLRDMFLTNVKVAAALLLVIGLAAAGAGWPTHSVRAPAGGVASASLTADSAANPFFVPETIDPEADCPQEMARADAQFLSGSFDDPGTDTDAASRPVLDDLKDIFELPAIRTILKRRDLSCEEDLRLQLQRMPELDIETRRKDQEATRLLFQRAREAHLDKEPHVTLGILGTRSNLVGLPFVGADNCELDRERALRLQELSRQMRSVIGEAKGLSDVNMLAVTVRLNLRSQSKVAGQGRQFEEHFKQAAAVPTLMQMLPAEAAPVRRVLVEQLARIDDPVSSRALARLAVFDLAPEVRADAVSVLAGRPKSDFRQVLLDGLRYPWAPAADHAAEALVALEDRTAVPALKRLIDQPDPAAPYMDTQAKAPLVQEIVRINHLRNCVMCHAPSIYAQDLVRAPVPNPTEPLPPPTFYYTPQGDMLVRADVTYLRQDFSVAQPVDLAAPWPVMQRYDYLVRTRPLQGPMPTGGQPASYPQRDAVLFALKELQTP